MIATMAKTAAYAIPIDAAETRSLERLKHHYEVEKKLAARLRHSTRAERRHLYCSLYNEMYELVPDHPLLTQKADPQTRHKNIAERAQSLGRFLTPASTFLEVGPGDCSLSLEVARRVKKVYAVEVSDEIVKNLVRRDNFEVVLSDGCSIPVPENSVDVAYSDQLMEHVHPEDVVEQLRNIFRALAPGGIYICRTPNRLSGPHDVSMYFDETATGFHLKEYTNSEIADLFKRVGFTKVKAFIRAGASFVAMPLLPTIALEKLLGQLYPTSRRRAANWRAISMLLGVRVIATK